MNGTERSAITVLILSIITCGIYYFYWIYTVSKEAKQFMGRDDINPTTELILCIVTCSLYQIYWWYKYGKIVTVDMYEKAGLKSEDSSMILMLLSILGLGIVSALIMQDKLNAIWRNNNAATKV